jgi:Tol biopolymer transport system component
MNADGQASRRLSVAPPGYVFTEALAWSPDGRSVVYGQRSHAGDAFALESLDLNTGRTTLILSDPGVGGFCWARDGRIIYARQEGPPNETSANLWEVSIDTRTAQVRSKPRRLTNWGGFLFGSLHISADGRRLSFVRQRFRRHIYVGNLEASGAWLTLPRVPRRLTFDEWINWPSGWTRDSKAILFFSDRNGDLDIFQQGMEDRGAHPVVTGKDEKRDPRLSPDGRWLLYLAWPKIGEQIRVGEGRLMRVAPGGGLPEPVSRVAGYPGPVRIEPSGTRPSFAGTGHPRFRCPSVPQAPCVLSEQVHDQAVFTAFDPAGGRGLEVARVAADPGRPTFWDLSPDGRWIAFGTREATSGVIQLVPLAGQAPRSVSAGGWTHLESVAWAANGAGLFVTSYGSKGFPLLFVSLDGHARLLHTAHYYAESPVPSPDGRYLAFGEISPEGNAWIIETER